MKRVTLAARLGWTLRKHWPIMTAVLPGVALALAHSTSFNVPSADLIDALDTDHYRIHWISGSYLLGSALGMALTGFFGSRIGFRRAYLLGVAMFTLAGTSCGFMTEIAGMTPLRFLQGLGNGLLISVGMVLIWRAFPKRRESAMALYGMAVYVPAVAGTFVGGMLTTWQSWRWIFFLLLPLGGVIFLMSSALLPPEPVPDRKSRIKLDLVGIGLLAASIVTLNVMLDFAQYWGWDASREFSLWLTGFAIAFCAFVAWGLGARHPLISLYVFRRKNTTLGLAIKVFFSVSLYVLLAVISVYMVNLRGYQWWQAALVISPAVLTMPISILLGIAFGERTNRKHRMAVGLVIMAAATWQLASIDLYTSKFWLAGMFAFWGLGAGVVIGPALMTIFEGLPSDETTMLAGVFNIIRSIPAFIATISLMTLWTQTTDAQFDTLRQNVRVNRPIVSESYEAARQHFVNRGSPREGSIKQSQALAGKWTHSNARAFALQEVLRVLTMVTLCALVPVLLVGGRNEEIGRRQPCALIHTQRICTPASGAS